MTFNFNCTDLCGRTSFQEFTMKNSNNYLTDRCLVIHVLRAYGAAATMKYTFKYCDLAHVCHCTIYDFDSQFNHPVERKQTRFFSPQFALTNYKNLILETNLLQNYMFFFINLIVAPTALISICYAKFRLHL